MLGWLRSEPLSTHKKTLPGINQRALLAHPMRELR